VHKNKSSGDCLSKKLSMSESEYSDRDASRRSRSGSERRSRSRSRSRSASSQASDDQSDRSASRSPKRESHASQGSPSGASRRESARSKSKSRSASRTSRSPSRSGSRSRSRSRSRIRSGSRSRSRSRSRSGYRSRSEDSGSRTRSRSGSRSRSKSRSTNDSRSYSRSRSSDRSSRSRGRSSYTGGSSYSRTGSRSFDSSDEGSYDSRDSYYDESTTTDDEEARKERDLLRDRFSDLPQPKVTDERRLFDDDYAAGLQANIKALSEHITDIQKKEISQLELFCSELKAYKNPSKEQSERKKCRALVDDIRQKRKKYRALLYDAISERDHLLESREIIKHEERVAKNRADRIDPYNGLDLFLLFFFGAQIGLIVLYIIFMDFTDNPFSIPDNILGYPTRTDYLFKFYTDITIMVFVGYSFVNGFLRKNVYSSIGTTFLVAAFSFQWALLWGGYFDWAKFGPESKIKLDIDSIISGMYAAATAVIALGAVIGRVNIMQATFMAFFSTFFYCLNFYVNSQVLNAVDLGGSMNIHLFAAVFGVSCSAVIGINDNEEYTLYPYDQRGSYITEALGFIGAFLLFIFFPSFNAAFAPDGAQFRAVINTVFGCVGGGIAVVGLAWCVMGRKQFIPFDLMNGLFMGGIALASAHSLLLDIFEAIIVGGVTAGTGYILLHTFLPYMNTRTKLPEWLRRQRWVYLIPRDTRGILFTHGACGFIGGLTAVIATAIYYDKDRFGQNSNELFPSESKQAGPLALTGLISMAIAGASGVTVGFFMLSMGKVTPKEFFPGGMRPEMRRFHDETSWMELPLDVDV